jgi:hypothetical protein
VSRLAGGKKPPGVWDWAMTRLTKIFALDRKGLNLQRGFAVAGVLAALVPATFLVTLVGGLAVKFGLHRCVSGELLTYWFLIAISLPLAYRADHIRVSTWKETVAWLIGAAL